jgi:TolB-like protein
VPLTPHTLDVLLYLAERPGKRCSIDEMLSALWPDTYPGDSAIYKAISALRKAFRDDSSHPSYIATGPKKSYRLIAPVQEVAPEQNTSSATSNNLTLFVGFGLIALIIFVSVALFRSAEITTIEVPWRENPSIAVLPFLNMSPDPDQEHFSDGVSEEILNALVKTNAIPVIARTSSFQFKDAGLSVQKIASTLKVTHILEGSVRRDGSQVRISAQLVDAQSGLQIWAGRYDRQLVDIFALQDELAAKIVKEIGIALPIELKAKNDSRPTGTRNQAAHDLYLQAKQLTNSGNPIEVEESLLLYEAALELDPAYVDALVEYGWTQLILAQHPLGHRIPIETVSIAVDAFHAALKLDPVNSRAMGYLGMALITSEYQWQEGLQMMKDSIALNAQDARVLAFYGITLYVVGHPDGMTVLEKAYSLNPFDIYTIMMRSVAFTLEGRIADATALVETALIQNRQQYDANILACLFSTEIGRFDEAEGHLERAVAIVGPDHPSIKRAQHRLASLRGDQKLADELAEELLNIAHTSRVTDIYSLGEDDEGKLVEVFNIAVNQRHWEIWFFLTQDKPERMAQSAWDGIQHTSRINAAKIGTPSYGFFSRSEEEETRLKLAAITMSNDKLELYAGEYEDPADGSLRKIERDETGLRSTGVDGIFHLVPTTRDHFEALERPIKYKFFIKNNKVTHYRWEWGQMSGIRNKIN